MDGRFENVLSKIGWGLCHYFLVGLCVVCTLTESAVSILMLIVVPLMACDLKYSKADVTVLNSCYSLGCACGSIIFGPMCDLRGRKNTISVTLVVIFASALVLAFSQIHALSLFSMFALGAGLTGNNLSLRVYMLEFLPPKKRGACLAILDFFWIIGHIFALVTTWSLIPSMIKLMRKEFRPNSWRVLIGLGASPVLVMACASSLFPHSPRYLIHRKRHQQALSILQQIYAVNNSKHIDTFPPVDLEDCIETVEDVDVHAGNIFKVTISYVSKTWKKLTILVSSTYIFLTISSALASPLLYPGLSLHALWDVSILNQLRQTNTHWLRTTSNNNSGGGNCEVGYGSMALAFIKDCRLANDPRFESLLLVSLSYLLGEALLAIVLDAAGRRVSLLCSGLITTTTLLGLVYAKNHQTRIVLSAFMLIAYSIGYTTLTITTIENFQTSVRGTLTGVTRFIIHLLVFAVNLLNAIPCHSAIFYAAGLYASSTLSAMSLPDLANLPMRE